MGIDDIRDRDDLVFNVFKDNHPIVEDYLRITKFPATATALLMLNTSSNFIKNSIFDVCETTDIYSGKILFRSLIDHFLRFNLLFLSWVTEKSDEVGHNYLSICDAKDVIDLMKAYKFVGTIRGVQRPSESDDEILKQFPNPIFQKYSKKEVEQLAQQYTYKNIIKKIRGY